MTNMNTIADLIGTESDVMSDRSKTFDDYVKMFEDARDSKIAFVAVRSVRLVNDGVCHVIFGDNSSMTFNRNEHRRDFNGEVRSGDFGPDSGHYHVYVECYSVMARQEDQDDNSCFPSREAAHQAAGPLRGGHVAVVGILPRDCDGK